MPAVVTAICPRKVFRPPQPCWLCDSKRTLNINTTCIAGAGRRERNTQTHAPNETTLMPESNKVKGRTPSVGCNNQAQLRAAQESISTRGEARRNRKMDFVFISHQFHHRVLSVHDLAHRPRILLQISAHWYLAVIKCEQKAKGQGFTTSLARQSRINSILMFALVFWNAVLNKNSI